MHPDRNDDRPGIGEAAQRQRRRKVMTIMGVLMVAGFVVGFASGRLEAEGGGFLDGIPAYWAITASAIFVAAVGIGGWWLRRMQDELERAQAHFAASIAFSAYLLTYPVWFLLWKGGLVIEPSHEALFIMAYIVMMLAYSWKKLRG